VLPERNETAQQGARANDHGCHGSCSEQHEPRQPRSWLILNVRQKMMTLIDAVRQIGALDGDLAIYAQHPWNPNSDARLAIEGSEEEAKAKAAGLRYFIEVFIARDFLEDWRASIKKPVSDVECCERLVEYATNDA
jgi:hypothetical protein